MSMLITLCILLLILYIINYKELNSYFTYNKYRKKIIINLMFIIICVYITIFLVSKATSYPKSDLVGTQDGWLSFSGGIIGSMTGMIGILMTIWHHNEKDKKDKQIQLCPNLYAINIKNDELHFSEYSNGRSPILLGYQIDLNIKCGSDNVAGNINYLGYNMKVNKPGNNQVYNSRTYNISLYGNVATRDEAIHISIPACVEYPFYRPENALPYYGTNVVYTIFLEYTNLINIKYMLIVHIETSFEFYNYRHDMGDEFSGYWKPGSNVYTKCFEDLDGNFGLKTDNLIKNITVNENEMEKIKSEIMYKRF